MKILLTGAAGMLAAEVIPVLLKQGHTVYQTDINRRLPDIEALDVTCGDKVVKLAREVKPDYIFHFAAETDVDFCEKDPEHAFRANALGTENMVKACGETSAKLVYISTGAVFDGKKDVPYIEADAPNPVNVYGESKLRGEKIIQTALDEYFIIRAGWMVGGWDLDKKFVYKIVQQLKSGKKELMAVSDKFGTPSFTKDFAANIMPIVNSGKYGLYHMVNNGTCTRHDMAVKIVEYMGLSDSVMVQSVDSSKFPLPAPRARSEMLENRRMKEMSIDNMPRWEDSLEEYIKLNKDK
ncbi:MAG: dTDP-4-dehydrorhamnose reductase [Candidatus Omnitrophica bacterium]|nr:dTDP-4-dehydrorhamnose reductase [Candidatus Omnitrophota bacterium]